MADVRLTATNPEDSSVVPVACDASGRLLLQDPEVVEGPQGPPGEQGPPGQDGQDGQDGDPFSGNFADDVTFGGSAQFAGDVQAPEVDVYKKGSDTPGASSGVIKLGIIDGASTITHAEVKALAIGSGGPGGYGGKLEFYTKEDYAQGGQRKLALTLSDTQNAKFEGDARFVGAVIAGQFNPFATDNTGAYINNLGVLEVQRQATEGPNEGVFKGWRGNVNTSEITAGGGATFANGKAGFTSEGYLWCTTRRGDTVVIDATVGGAGLWVEYNPVSRIDEIRDKLDANTPQTGEMPADTP